MNSSGCVRCHCSLIEALDAVSIRVFSRTHPPSLPRQAFVFWRPTHCGALTGSAEQRSSGEPRPLFLCLSQCSFKAWVPLKSCTSTDIILKGETCHIFPDTHVYGFAHTLNMPSMSVFQHYRSRLNPQVLMHLFYPGLIRLRKITQVDVCVIKCTYPLYVLCTALTGKTLVSDVPKGDNTIWIILNASTVIQWSTFAACLHPQWGNLNWSRNIDGT